ncbi:NAD-dependent epimerase/dehydratase family protein [Sphingomonas sp. S6]|jgi:nucleoside-diphosphate-sugar epimerase|uniref:NAD-dependent epimerase/dehydratase family protein n=1 Tax=Sphingomonas sp. S6 TaxID=3368600 RepID=UPI0028E2A0D2|nr:NAD-dependent epimerase/dehydratase family protein [uncultured Sphingomonas sp.]
MPRALVTGATGFIGGHLVDVLARAGWEVHALARTTPPPHPAQIHWLDGSQQRLQAILSDVQPDVTFHLASLFLATHTPEQAEDLATANIVFPLQLVEAMVRTGCRRLVNTGTAWQFAETGAPLPVNLYAATKQAFDAILTYYQDAEALSVVSLRLFDTYGPGDPRRKLIRILLDAARSGEVLDMSPGEQIVDLTHVDDVVAAFMTAGQRLITTPDPLAEDWFVSGERQTLRGLVTKVEQALALSLNVNFGGRPYRDREVMVPTDPSKKILPDWRPQRSLAEALPAMIST